MQATARTSRRRPGPEWSSPGSPAAAGALPAACGRWLSWGGRLWGGWGRWVATWLLGPWRSCSACRAGHGRSPWRSPRGWRRRGPWRGRRCWPSTPRTGPTTASSTTPRERAAPAGAGRAGLGRPGVRRGGGVGAWCGGGGAAGGGHPGGRRGAAGPAPAQRGHGRPDPLLGHRGRLPPGDGLPGDGGDAGRGAAST